MALIKTYKELELGTNEYFEELEKANNLSARVGWLTWEDFKKVNPNCCKWLK